MVFLLVVKFPRNSVFIFFYRFNMVSEWSKDETLDANLGETQTDHETANAAAEINAAVEKLLQHLQKPPVSSSIFTLGASRAT